MGFQKIYLSPPDVGLLEEEYVVSALKSGWVAPLGPEADAFEQEVARRVGAEHAVALSSGTAGLHLGLISLGVGPGDIVLTSTLTFAATANAIAYCGAEPIFIDCDLETGNMSLDILGDSIKKIQSEGRTIKAILPVDLLGKAVNYSELIELESNVPILADAAESFGASHAGKMTGSFGDASVFSFNGNKIMTTSGGGMLVTSKKEIADKVRYLATQARQPVAHYEHTDIGYNYRMSNLLAALGRAQLSRLDLMIERRRSFRRAYKELFEGVPGVSVFQAEGDSEDNCWLTAILVDPVKARWEPGDLASFLESQNIESRPLWKPMHLQPVFKKHRAFLNGNSEQLFKQGLALPSGSAMTDEQFERVTGAIKKFLGKNR